MRRHWLGRYDRVRNLRGRLTPRGIAVGASLGIERRRPRQQLLTGGRSPTWACSASNAVPRSSRCCSRPCSRLSPEPDELDVSYVFHRRAGLL